MKQTSSTTFQPDWLALREPADHAARDLGLLAKAATLVGPDQRVLDLGSGTGSTARAFASHGFAGLNWRFLDQDKTLLDIAKAQHPTAEVIAAPLADIDALPLDNVGLVTASALLDLMPVAWVETLAKKLAAHRIPFYGALNYNGIMGWTPQHAYDTAITDHFNAHQRSDKGLGTALGPLSAPETTRIFQDAGYNVTQGDSPWRIGPDQADLNRELLTGIANAAAEAGFADADSWLAHRLKNIPQLQSVVGHTDVLAIYG